jgi:hypothetical protein
MNVSTFNKNKFSVKVRTDEASRLLDGLEIMRDDLGTLAEELIALLRENGVTPSRNTVSPHTRSGAKH